MLRTGDCPQCITEPADGDRQPAWCGSVMSSNIGILQERKGTTGINGDKSQNSLLPCDHYGVEKEMRDNKNSTQYCSANSRK